MFSLRKIPRKEMVALLPYKNMNEINNCQISQTEEMLSVTTQKLQFTYDLREKFYRFSFPDSPHPAQEKAGFSYTYGDMTYSQKHLIGIAAETELTASDFSGNAGVEVSVKHKFGDLHIQQIFWFFSEQSYFLSRLDLSGEDFIRSRQMSPLVLSGEVLSLKGAKSARLLYVPYDNDKWTRFKAQEMQECGISYEVTAAYDEDSRNGYVIGSVTHDQWKTGITTHGGHNSLSFLTIYGGVADSATRDTAMPHGYVQGLTISSPTIFTGYYEDFRDGLIEYGNVNNQICPRLKWNHGVPFGWNSWACLATNVTLDAFKKTSETLEAFQENGFLSDDTVYINFDAFWDRLSTDELKTAVETAHNRGQKAGIYYTPFTCWTHDFNQIVENTNEQYTYRDILLRDTAGNPLPPIAGGYPIDPTHPANLIRVEAMMKFLVDLEFDYLKVDFMSHGTCEGVHYLHTITTGIEAYCYGLKHMLSFLSPEAAKRDIFVDFSIAPIFPYQFAHSRRISCDVFGQFYDTEYMLNSLTYGFWQNQTIYEYNDPDHTCLYKSVWRDVSEPEEAKSRLLASVIAGTVLLLSDDYQDPKAIERTKSLLTPKLMEIARKGQTFLPVETATLDRASKIFTRDDGDVFYIAVFNLSPDAGSITVDTTRLDAVAHGLTFTSLESDRCYKGELFNVELAAKESVILAGFKA